MSKLEQFTTPDLHASPWLNREGLLYRAYYRDKEDNPGPYEPCQRIRGVWEGDVYRECFYDKDTGDCLGERRYTFDGEGRALEMRETGSDHAALYGESRIFWNPGEREITGTAREKHRQGRLEEQIFTYDRDNNLREYLLRIDGEVLRTETFVYLTKWAILRSFRFIHEGDQFRIKESPIYFSHPTGPWVLYPKARPYLFEKPRTRTLCF